MDSDNFWFEVQVQVENKFNRICLGIANKQYNNTSGALRLKALFNFSPVAK